MTKFGHYESYKAAKEALNKIKDNPHLSPREKASLEKAIALSPSHIAEYGFFTKSRFLEGEKNILANIQKDCNNHGYYNSYIKEAIGGRWEEYEKEIQKKKNSVALASYALDVLESPWKEAEESMFKKFGCNHIASEQIKRYLATFYPKGNETLDQTILTKMRDADVACSLSSYERSELCHYFKSRGIWQELEEELIASDGLGVVSFFYCMYAKKSRHKAIENKMLSNISRISKLDPSKDSATIIAIGTSVNLYARNLVKESWPELENKLESVELTEKTPYPLRDLIIDYARYCKKAYFKGILRLRDAAGWRNNHYKNYTTSAKKQIEKLIKKKKFDEALNCYGEFPEFIKIITGLEKKYVISDSIKNFMLANRIVDEKNKNLIKYFEQDKLFREKMKQFLEEFKELTVQEILQKIG